MRFCEKCGYMFGDGETECARCANAREAEEGATRDTAPGDAAGSAKGPRPAATQWMIAGCVLVLLASCFAIWKALPPAGEKDDGQAPKAVQSGRAVQPPAPRVSPATGASPANTPPAAIQQTIQPAPSAPVPAGQPNQAPQPEQNAAAQPPAWDPIVKQCPLSLIPGKQIRPKPGSVTRTAIIRDFSASGSAGQGGGISVGGWTIRGVGEQSLKVTMEGGFAIWVDQPFELLADGTLVATFQNTEEYNQAQQ